jgi:putative ABC transport system substrate-binding protein
VIHRRDLITLLGGAAAAWPHAAPAQQATMPVIGYLSNGSREAEASRLTAFRMGLNEVGYVEGRNLAIEYRWADGQNDRLPALAADLVRRQVAVVTGMESTAAALAAKSATAVIPLVFAIGADPVRVGLVKSLNRPEGNVTGVTAFSNALVAKRLEILHELIPKANVIGFLVNPANPNSANDIEDAQAAARVLGLTLQVMRASNTGEIDLAFAELVRRQIGGFFLDADSLFSIRRNQFSALALRHAIPAAYPNAEYVAAGGLLSYGTDRAETYHQLGIYTGRVIKGEKPASLPVMQPSKFQLVINLTTAKALNLDVPAKLLAIADEVIE